MAPTHKFYLENSPCLPLLPTIIPQEVTARGSEGALDLKTQRPASNGGLIRNLHKLIFGEGG